MSNEDIPKKDVSGLRILFGGQLRQPTILPLVFHKNSEFWSPPTFTHSLIEQKLAFARTVGGKEVKSVGKEFMWGRDLRHLYSYPFVCQLIKSLFPQPV